LRGTAWIELAGEITSYELTAGQSLLVHPGHVGVFQDSVGFQITRIPDIANKVFGEDSFHVVALTGPGTVWFQSMPLSIFAHALVPYLGTPAQSGTAFAGGMAGGVIADNLFGRVV